MPHRRPLGAVSIVALLLPLTALASSPSYAAGETCDGKPATIVIGAGSSPQEFGTPGTTSW